MSNCGGCKLPLSAEGEGATCSACKFKFHFSECCSLKDVSWRTMGPRRRSNWTCADCRKKNGGKEDENDDDDEDVNDHDAVEIEEDIRKEKALRVEALEKVRDPMAKQLMTLFDKRFDSFEKTIAKMMLESEKKVGQKLADFEDNLNFYGDKVEEASSTVKNIQQKLVLIEKRLEKSENENMELKTRLRNLEIQLVETTQQEYNNKIEISGFKGIVNEVEVTNKILAKADFAAGEVDFKALKITRVGEDKREKQSIVVQFRSQEVRNAVMSKIKKNKTYTKLQGILESDGSSIFINESLSPYYKKVLYEASKVKKEKNYQFLWVKEGKILLKKNVTSNIQKIKCLADIGKM